jgi:hypothetical protein
MSVMLRYDISVDEVEQTDQTEGSEKMKMWRRFLRRFLLRFFPSRVNDSWPINLYDGG